MSDAWLSLARFSFGCKSELLLFFISVETYMESLAVDVDVKANAATNTSGLNLLISYSKCQYSS